MHKRPRESKETLVLRGAILQLILHRLADTEHADADSNLMAVLHVIAGETIGRMDTYSERHQSGIMQMVIRRGGLRNLGLDGFLASMISWLLSEASILREQKPADIVRDYCSSRSIKVYSNTATIPESPLYRPRQTYLTLQRSSSCTRETMSMIEKMRRTIQILLIEVSSANWFRQSRPVLTFMTRNRRRILIMRLSRNSPMVS